MFPRRGEEPDCFRQPSSGRRNGRKLPSADDAMLRRTSTRALLICTVYRIGGYYIGGRLERCCAHLTERWIHDREKVQTGVHVRHCGNEAEMLISCAGGGSASIRGAGRRLRSRGADPGAFGLQPLRRRSRHLAEGMMRRHANARTPRAEALGAEVLKRLTQHA